MELRDAEASDAPFLMRVLAMAMAWRPGTTEMSDREILATPWAAHYVAGWPQPGDTGVVACDPEPIGATWWRYFSDDDHGFGFVASDVPEVTIAVRHGFRARGVGRQLMHRLITRARDDCLPGLSLSVEPDNPARRLYETVGFRDVGRTGGAVTMLLGFSDRLGDAAGGKRQR